MNTLEFILMMAGISIVLYSPLYLGSVFRSRKNQEIRDRVFSGNFMTATEFNGSWVKKGFTGNYGSKYGDGPGCYIILMFSRPVVNGDYSNYENGYIGQSVTACARVRNHLTGKGNGDVYADVRNGKYVYVKIITCSVAELNDLETRLIGAFDMKRLYNRSKGGGSKHEGTPDRRYSGNFNTAVGGVRNNHDTSAPPKSYAESAVRKSQQNPVHENPKPQPNVQASSPSNPLDDLKSKAMSGDVYAQYKLGKLYELGESVPKDEFYAFMWYKMAAERGHPEAMLQLAMMYEEGRGTQKNPYEARRLLTLLARSGNERAIQKLNQLSRL